jgi:glutathione synthase/RimK-type ligase-like ATP-grasp enzyme
MKRIALASCAAWPNLSEDDRLLIPALQQFNVEAVPAIWDGSVDWTQFDLVIVRSCWDYHLRPSKFLGWITKLEKAGVPVQNLPHLIRWNADKRYLRQLRESGASIPHSVWIEDREEVNVHHIMQEQDWISAVVKPTVSASAHNLRRVGKDDPVVSLKGPALVQQFIPEIVSSGEWSLVFLGGEFSHAVIKRPGPEDFRVQSQFGGKSTLANPRAEIVEEARRVVASLPGEPLYARIDGVDCAGQFVLMEVELIEPELFLGVGNASDRFAEKIAGVLDGHEPSSKPSRSHLASAK